MWNRHWILLLVHALLSPLAFASSGVFCFSLNLICSGAVLLSFGSDTRSMLILSNLGHIRRASSYGGLFHYGARGIYA